MTKPRTDRYWLAIVLAAAVGLMCIALSSHAQTARPAATPGVFAGLRAGQDVTLKDVGHGYEISVFSRTVAPLAHKVVEIGSDYVVIKDVVGVNTIRIPVYAVKNVTTVNIDVRQ